MLEAVTLELFLERWAEDEKPRRAVADTIIVLADGCRAIGTRISKGALPGGLCDFSNGNTVVALGQANFETDYEAHAILQEALKNAPVLAIASRLHEAPVTLSNDGSLIVALSPLDGSATIDTNAAMGTVFSILPLPDKNNSDSGPDTHNHTADAFLQPGTRQLAAGFAIYGPRTNLVVTVGDGTHVFTLDTDTNRFIATALDIKVPATVTEYAINAANYRHWDEAIRTYVDDCLKGSQGLRALDFNMRWIGSPVAEIYRIFMRGGIYLYPADTREGFSQGRFWQIFEANPIAFIVEQAGGAASTGRERILDMLPDNLQQKVPIILGSKDEVEYVGRLHTDPFAHGERSPLFGRRGLFRT